MFIITGKRDTNGIFFDRNSANTYLSQKRDKRSFKEIYNGRNQGLACECCIYRCTAQEMAQYCGDKVSRRRRRSIRSILSGNLQPPPIFTQQDVDAIYREIDNEEIETEEKNFSINLQEYQNILKLEANKNRYLKNKNTNKILNTKDTSIKKSSAPQSVERTPAALTAQTVHTVKIKHRHRHKHSRRNS